MVVNNCSRVPPLISACMIVKNEADALPECLSSLRDYIDEICIVDTGSTDETVTVARSFGATVSFHEWTNDFSAARNAALRQATGQWILIIDADETLCREDGPALRRLLESSEHEAYFIQLLSFIKDNSPDSVVRNQVVRLIRNRPAYCYNGRIHEGLDLTSAQGKVAYSDIRIYHYGYLKDVIHRKEKRQRNLSLLQKEVDQNPENPYFRFNIGTEYFNLGEYEKALEHYEEAARWASPKHLYAHLLVKRRISCLQALGRHFKALQVAKQAQKQFPHFTDVVFQKAQSFLCMGQLTNALQTFRSCVEIGEPTGVFHPLEEVGVGSYKALWWIGQIHERLQNEAPAVDAYREALLHQPCYRPAMERLIKLLRSNLSEEETVMQMFPAGAPDDNAVILAASIFRERGDYRAVRALIENYPLSPGLVDLQHYWEGLSLVRLGEIQRGRELLKSIPETSPQFEQSVLEQIVAAWLEEDFATAGNLLEEYEARFGVTKVMRSYQAVNKFWVDGEIQEDTSFNTDKGLSLVLDIIRAFHARKKVDFVRSLERLVLANFGKDAAGAIARIYTTSDILDSGDLATGHDTKAVPGPDPNFLLGWVEESELGFEEWMDMGRLAWRQGRLVQAVDFYRRASQLDTCWGAAYYEPALALVRGAEKVIDHALERFPEAEPLRRAKSLLNDGENTSE